MTHTDHTVGRAVRSDGVTVTWNGRDVASFLTLTFAMTWALHGALVLSGARYSLDSPSALLYLLGLLAPSTTAFLIEYRARGRGGVHALRALARPRTSRPRRLVASALVPVALTASAAALAGGDGSVDVDVAMTIGQVWVVCGEEFGWRGWLWPRAAQRFGPTTGTLLVTAVWALWHVPMFAVSGSPQADDGIVAFAAAIAAWGLLHGALQLGQPSVFTALVFHAAANISVSSLDIERSARAIVHVIAAAATLAWLSWQGRRTTTT